MASEIKHNPFNDNEIDSIKDLGYSLTLHNDNHNSFDYVVECLVDICEHDALQAEQCTLIAHHKGKCSVKNGGFSTLKELKDELIRRGLSATIDNGF